MWLLIKESVIDIVKYVFPTIALGISILSFCNVRKASKVKDRLLVVEEKLKTYKLEKIEKKKKVLKKLVLRL